jgi:hypothetical protein
MAMASRWCTRRAATALGARQACVGRSCAALVAPQATGPLEEVQA